MNLSQQIDRTATVRVGNYGPSPSITFNPICQFSVSTMVLGETAAASGVAAMSRVPFCHPGQVACRGDVRDVFCTVLYVLSGPVAITRLCFF